MTWVAKLFDRRAVRRYLLVDIVAIVGFLVAGELHHGIDPVDSPVYVGETIAPFLIGWVVAAPVLGAYASVTVERPVWAALFVVPAWVGANSIGQALRATDLFHGGSSPVFALVIGAGGVVVLGAVRTVVLAWERREE